MSFRKLSLSTLLIVGCTLAILALNTAKIGGAQAATPAATSSGITVHFASPDTGPILSPGDNGQWDAVSVRFPQVVLYKDTYYLFYGTFQTMTDPVGIGYATSSDGLHWTKFDKNPVLTGSGAGFDAFGVTRPVLTVEADGTWVMYYDGLPARNIVFGKGIGRATPLSPSGPWTRSADPVLTTGGQGEWDSRFLFPDSVVYDGNQYIMYYSAQFTAGQVGRATSSDGIHWTKYKAPGSSADSDPVLTLGPAGSWDSALAWGSSVQHTQNGWEMFYYGGNDLTGGPNSFVKIGYAYSVDGITWTKYVNNPVISADKQEAFFPSFLINADSTYSVYYAEAPGGAFTEFHLATGTITRNGS